jgi:Spy/CpxP family protein refolding chaperone
MGTHKRRGSRMMRALRTLGLSDTQKAQIKAARQSYRASRTSRTPETPAQFRAQIENILTPAQRTQFQAAMQRNRRNRMAPTVSPTP